MRTRVTQTGVNRHLKLILILAAAAVFGVLSQPAGADQGKAIVGATVVDLYGDEPIENAVVLIEGERIIAIGSEATVDVPATAEVINAEGTWLIPGMMNMHVHLGPVLPGKLAAELANENEGELTLRMAVHAREILQAGIDSIEHGYFLDREVLRLMKKNGTWLVPTILVSQPALQQFFEEIGSPP